MARIEIYRDQALVERIDLAEASYKIGRRPDNRIVLPDLTVSRLHARLFYDTPGRCWLLENLSQTNPVRINLEKITRPHILFDGDRISIGVFTLVFREGESI